MVIVITGGSSGLGESITRKLASDPAVQIYFTYNNSKVKSGKIEEDLSNTHAIKCNFSNEEDVDSLKNQISQLNPDVLINNAYSGTFMKAHFHKTPHEDFLSEFQNNIIPTIIVTQEAIKGFRKKKGGKIITILTSALLNVPPTGSAIYVANKAYMEKLTKVWASENVKYNITSNSISPSFMLTDFTKDIDERIVEQVKDSHPLKTILSTDEVADTVSFLVNATNQINGIDIVINSGASLK